MLIRTLLIGLTSLSIGLAHAQELNSSSAPPEIIKLSPQIRYSALSGPTTQPPPAGLTKLLPLVFEGDHLPPLPHVQLTQGPSTIVSAGDLIEASDLPDQVLRFQIIRQPQALVDPDTKQVLAYEAVSVGFAHRESKVNKLLRIDIANAEVTANDLLFPVLDDVQPPRLETSPATTDNIEAKVLSSLPHDATLLAEHQIVSLNRGSAEGVQLGLVLHSADHKNEIQVISTFEHVSYAVILKTERNVELGEVFRACSH